MSKQIPKLFFVGAGNIAQSIIRGIIKARPNAATRILATAPTSKNLDVVKSVLGCKTTLLDNASNTLNEFEPDFVFLCVKPQVLMNSIMKCDQLSHLLQSMPENCTALSLLAGIRREVFTSAFKIPAENIVRVMLNTAAELGSTSVVYHIDQELVSRKTKEMEDLFRLFGQAIVRLSDEKLMDVATGLCGSGIAFFYEMIQTISDIGVMNGLNRADSTLIAAQLSKSAGEMLLTKRSHPYQLRDEVTSPAGTTIYGLNSWHEGSTNQRIAKAFQTSIDRAKSLSAISEAKFDKDR